MKQDKISVPETVFGIETRILLIWLKPFLVGVFIILISGLVYWPKLTETQGILSEIKKSQKNLVTINEKIAYLQSIDQAELEANSMILANGVLPEKNSYLLVNIVKKTIAEFGFDVAEFSVSMGEIGEKKEEIKKVTAEYEKVPVTIKINGPKSNYLSLIAGLEKSLPILSIDNFEMKVSNQVSTIELIISAYYLPDKIKSNIENFSLAELTLTQEEAGLLDKIREYKNYGGSVSVDSPILEYKNFGREDPFFGQ